MRLIVKVAFGTPVATTVSLLVCPVMKTSLYRVSMPTCRLMTSLNRTEHSDGEFAVVFVRIAYFVTDAGIGSDRVMKIPKKWKSEPLARIRRVGSDRDQNPLRRS
jgi:hypothetical protein